MGAKLNLDFYTGADYYSDGDIEDELLEIVRKLMISVKYWQRMIVGRFFTIFLR